MNIKDYYNDYNNNSEYFPKLNCAVAVSNTIDDFYNNCIKATELPIKNVIAWHNMLMKYIDLPDAIYWIRYYESKGKGFDKLTGRHNNRRACFTRFSDGFSYVFVSNFDAHEIYNMIAKGVVPSATEFLNLMKSFTFPMHYDPSKHCEESDIVSYPHIGYHKAGVLTNSKWYLAHINAVKSAYIMPDGTNRVLNKKEIERIYPRGIISDWKIDGRTGKFIRDLNYSLTNDEKNLVKAHFLRFIDPLNYFLTPSKSCETNDVTAANVNVGEFPELTKYMRLKYISTYGVKVVNEFCKKALISNNPIIVNSSYILNVTYGSNLKKVKIKKTPKPSKKIDRAYEIISNAIKNSILTEDGINYLLSKKSKEVFKTSNNVLTKDISSANPKEYHLDPSEIVTFKGTKYAILSTAIDNLSIDKWEESLTVKVMQYAYIVIKCAVEYGKMDPVTFAKLLDKNESKKIFGCYYPVLVKTGSSYPVDRYSKNLVIKYMSSDYYLTNDWYDRNRKKLIDFDLAQTYTAGDLIRKTIVDMFRNGNINNKILDLMSDVNKCHAVSKQNKPFIMKESAVLGNKVLERVYNGRHFNISYNGDVYLLWNQWRAQHMHDIKLWVIKNLPY